MKTFTLTWVALALVMGGANCSSHGSNAKHDEKAEGAHREQEIADKDDDDDDDKEDEAKEMDASHRQAKEKAGEDEARFSFESDDVGKAPKGWTAAETNGAGKPATWRVEALAGAPNGKNVLRLAETKNGDGTFNLLLTDATYPADLYVEVKIHADSGKEDQGGGLVWRAKDADNYYIARWNPLENNFRVYKVEAGKRKMLQSANVTADAAKWHEVKVEMKGPHITCFLDDTKHLECDDETFRDGGRVGLWTKADAASSFDEFEVSWTRRK